MALIKDKKITHLELIEYARDFLQENYNINLTIPININNRLRRSLGRYIIYMGSPNKIELSGRVVKYGTNNVILDTLRHELIHYALHVLGKPYRDGSAYFENELSKHNTSSTCTTNVDKFYIFECSDCGGEVKTTTKNTFNNPHRYQSKCCKSELIYIKTLINNGENIYILK